MPPSQFPLLFSCYFSVLLISLKNNCVFTHESRWCCLYWSSQSFQSDPMLWFGNAKELLGLSEYIFLNWDSQFFMKIRSILSYVDSYPQWLLPKLYFQECCTSNEYMQSNIFIHQNNIRKCSRQKCYVISRR